MVAYGAAACSMATLRGGAVALQVLLLCELVVFSVSTVPGVRSATGFHVPLDGWLQAAGYVTAALVALLRTVLGRADRALWGVVAAALVARAAGFVAFLAVVRTQRPMPMPSIADVAWLTMELLLMGALVVLARARLPRLSTALALDGLVGLLATAGFAVALVWRPLVHTMTSGGTPAAIATNLAYPVLDVALLLAITTVLIAFEWSPPPAVWALGAGTVGFAVTDGIFLFQSVNGTFRPGTLLSALSLSATCVLAWAGWLPEHARGPRRGGDLPDVVVPALYGLACLTLLVYASVRSVPALSVALTAAGATVAIARTALAFRTVRSVAEHRREARTDDLTGLPNRRAFAETLARALRDRPPSRRLALLVADLDDFKA